MIDDSEFKVRRVEEAIDYINRVIDMQKPYIGEIDYELYIKLKDFTPCGEKVKIHLDVIGTANAGLKALLENEYDLLILDWNLPRFPDSIKIEPLGEEILKRIDNYIKRNRLKDIPVIIFSTDINNGVLSGYHNIVALLQDTNIKIDRDSICYSIKNVFTYRKPKTLIF